MSNELVLAKLDECRTYFSLENIIVTEVAMGEKIFGREGSTKDLEKIPGFGLKRPTHLSREITLVIRFDEVLK